MVQALQAAALRMGNMGAKWETSATKKGDLLEKIWKIWMKSVRNDVKSEISSGIGIGVGHDFVPATDIWTLRMGSHRGACWCNHENKG